MGVYEPLKKHLESLSSPEWDTNFSEIERIISRKLPDSAYEYRPWWGNQKKGNHSQAKAWREAGWEIRDVSLERKVVRFERVSHSGRHGDKTDSFEELRAKAKKISGIDDDSELLKAALTSFINQELAHYFAGLGGTMPNAQAAPRRRFD